MVVDQMNDLFDEYYRVRFFTTDEDVKKKLLNKLYNETFPNNMAMLERLLTKQNTKFFSSNKVTWADYAFAGMMDKMNEKKGFFMENCPRVKAIDEFIHNDPKIISWREKRPKTEL